MAETIQEAMKRVSSKQRPLFKGNALLTTQHLQYFKPLKTPQNVLDENILLKEIITVNPLTSVVEVKGKALYITPMDRGKYTKPYRTWICTESATKVLEKIGLDDPGTVLGVNAPKRLVSSIDDQPYSGFNKDDDIYLIRRSINPKYMEMINHFTIATDNIDYVLINSNINNTDLKLYSRDAEVSIYRYIRDRAITTINIDPTDTSIENYFLPNNTSNSNFNEFYLLNYTYEFTPKYSESIPNIITFYEKLVGGELWNTNPAYSGKIPERIIENNYIFFLTYGTSYNPNENDKLLIDGDVYLRSINDEGRVTYTQNITSNIYGANIFAPGGDTASSVPIFVKTNGRYVNLINYALEKNIPIDFNTVDGYSVRFSLLSRGNTIDYEEYFDKKSGYDDSIKRYDLNIRRSGLLPIDKDGNHYGKNHRLSSINKTLLFFTDIDYLTATTNNVRFINGGFHTPITMDKDYIFDFKHLPDLYNQDYQSNLNKLEEKIELFKQSKHFWDEKNNRELPAYRLNGSAYDDNSSSSQSHYGLNPFSHAFGYNNNTSLPNVGIEYLLRYTYTLRNQIEVLNSGVDKYGRANAIFKRRKFLEAYNTLRCKLASLISGIGTYYITENLDTDYSTVNLTQFYLGFETFNHRDVAGLDTIVPIKSLYERIILGVDDNNIGESFLLSFPLAKRMEIVYKGVTYTYHNYGYSDGYSSLDLDAPIDRYGDTVFVPTFGVPAHFITNENITLSHLDKVFEYYNVVYNNYYNKNNNFNTPGAGVLRLNENNISLNIPNIIGVLSTYPLDGDPMSAVIYNNFDITQGKQTKNLTYERFGGVLLTTHGKDISEMVNSGFEGDPSTEWQEYVNYCYENGLSVYRNVAQDSYGVVTSLDMLKGEYIKNDVKITLFFDRLGLDPNLDHPVDEEVSRTYVVKGTTGFTQYSD